ncbi:MAG: FAD-dependent oxidoreductase [Fibrobacterota bacterium]
MAKHERFHLRSLDDLKHKLHELKTSLPLSEDQSIMFQRVRFAGKEAPNRYAVHPMEGFDSSPEGAPGLLSFRRYTRYAAGGSGLIWFEATAVRNECRTNPGQFWLHEGTVDVFSRLVDDTRKAARKSFGADHNPVLVLQLTHSGRYSKKDGKPKPIIAHHSAVLDPVHTLPPDYPLISDEELDRLQDDFLAAARLAARAGFDGVDIKSCHRYLLSELLASFTRENSRYGGNFENRTRMLRETAKKIKDNVTGLFVTSRLNVFDAIRAPYGWGVSMDDERTPDLSEPVQLIKLLRQIDYPVLNVSIANPYFNPHWGRPYDFPIVGGHAPDTHPLEGVAFIIKTIGDVQKAVPDLPIISSGFSWLRHWMPYVAAGAVKEGYATLVGQGRGAFAYPDSVKDLMENGEMDPRKACVACSGCTQLMRDGGKTGCIIRDSAVYGPEYRKARERSEDTLKEQAKRCRDCAFPNCQTGCPASVDVPAFVKAFEEGDIKKSYGILKEGNVLPELCAYVCPSEVQCEQYCMEAIMNGAAVPVREIQQFVARRARERGYVTTRLPEKENGKKAAVIGAGPAGVACAVRLLESGFCVDVYDKSQNAGGTPLDVIPAWRLTAGDTLGEIGTLLKDGLAQKRLTLVPNFELSPAHTLESLRKKGYHAVFLGMGLGKSQALPNASRPKSGGEDALVFLKRHKNGADIGVPARVAVLGGGNTAMDAALTAKKAGARDVYIVYRRSFEELPAWPKERDQVLANGVHFLILSQPVDYVSENGKLTGLKMARTVLGEPDKSGRRKPVTVENSESVLPVDLVIEALGQLPVASLEKMLPGITLNEGGFVRVDEHFATSLQNVYAGGDLVNGGTTAVRAIAEGMKAAAAMAAGIR